MSITGGRGAPPLEKFSFLRAATAWSDLIGPPVRDALKARAPVGKGGNSGALRQSIRFERNVIVGGVSVTFISSVPYAGYVISGTQPHTIAARYARALRFTPAGATEPVYRRSVYHPGTKANPFPREALIVMRPFLQQTLRDMMSRE